MLIVEDDRELAAALALSLTRHGVASDHAATAGDAQQMIAAASYAAILLDLGLPDGDGVDVLRAVRARGDDTPVIVLTARGGVGARVAGLDAGADDLLVKPFAIEELMARLRAVSRRRAPFQRSVIVLGSAQFDTDALELQVRGQVVALSAREAELFALLARRVGRVVGKQLAEDQLFGLSAELGSNAVEVYVHRLRRRLERADADLRIETIRGIGYLLQVMA